MKFNWNACTAIATIIIAIGGLIGLYFVIGEFGELRKSNEISLNIIRQSYRPLAILKFTYEKPDLIIVSYRDADSPDLFSFGYEEKIVNKGLGVLIYLGNVSYLSKSELDFRKSLLDGKIDSVVKDEIPSYVRRRPLMPADTFVFFTPWENIPFSRQYFAYSLHFYEDQNGDLYDTEHLNVFTFTKPFRENNKLRTKLEPGSAFREIYHYYSKEEKLKLIKSLEKLGDPISHVLSLP